MDSQNGAKLVAVDEDVELPVEAVSEEHFEGERGEPAQFPRSLTDSERFLAPPEFRKNHHPHTDY